MAFSYIFTPLPSIAPSHSSRSFYSSKQAPFLLASPPIYWFKEGFLHVSELGFLGMPGWGDVCRSMGEALSTGVLLVGYFLERAPYHWPPHWRECFPFVQQLLTSYRSSDKVGPCDLPPLLHDGMLTCPVLCLSFACNHSYWWFENISFAFKQPRHRGSSRVKTLFPWSLHTEAGLSCCPSIVFPSAYRKPLACPLSYLLCACSHGCPRPWLHMWGNNIFLLRWQIRVGSSVETKSQNDFFAPSPTRPPTRPLNL